MCDKPNLNSPWLGLCNFFVAYALALTFQPLVFRMGPGPLLLFSSLLQHGMVSPSRLLANPSETERTAVFHPPLENYGLMWNAVREPALFDFALLFKASSLARTFVESPVYTSKLQEGVFTSKCYVRCDQCDYYKMGTGWNICLLLTPNLLAC